MFDNGPNQTIDSNGSLRSKKRKSLVAATFKSNANFTGTGSGSSLTMDKTGLPTLKLLPLNGKCFILSCGYSRGYF